MRRKQITRNTKCSTKRHQDKQQQVLALRTANNRKILQNADHQNTVNEQTQLTSTIKRLHTMEIKIRGDWMAVSCEQIEQEVERVLGITLGGGMEEMKVRILELVTSMLICLQSHGRRLEIINKWMDSLNRILTAVLQFLSNNISFPVYLLCMRVGTMILQWQNNRHLHNHAQYDKLLGVIELVRANYPCRSISHQYKPSYILKYILQLIRSILSAPSMQEIQIQQQQQQFQQRQQYQQIAWLCDTYIHYLGNRALVIEIMELFQFVAGVHGVGEYVHGRVWDGVGLAVTPKQMEILIILMCRYATQHNVNDCIAKILSIYWYHTNKPNYIHQSNHNYTHNYTHNQIHNQIHNQHNNQNMICCTMISSLHSYTTPGLRHSLLQYLQSPNPSSISDNSYLKKTIGCLLSQCTSWSDIWGRVRDVEGLLGVCLGGGEVECVSGVLPWVEEELKRVYFGGSQQIVGAARKYAAIRVLMAHYGKLYNICKDRTLLDMLEKAVGHMAQLVRLAGREIDDRVVECGIALGAQLLHYARQRMKDSQHMGRWEQIVDGLFAELDLIDRQWSSECSGHILQLRIHTKCKKIYKISLQNRQNNLCSIVLHLQNTLRQGKYTDIMGNQPYNSGVYLGLLVNILGGRDMEKWCGQMARSSKKQQCIGGVCGLAVGWLVSQNSLQLTMANQQAINNDKKCTLIISALTKIQQQQQYKPPVDVTQQQQPFICTELLDYYLKLLIRQINYYILTIMGWNLLAQLLGTMGDQGQQYFQTMYNLKTRLTQIQFPKCQRSQIKIYSWLQDVIQKPIVSILQSVINRSQSRYSPLLLSLIDGWKAAVPLNEYKSLPIVTKIDARVIQFICLYCKQHQIEGLRTQTNESSHQIEIVMTGNNKLRAIHKIRKQ